MDLGTLLKNVSEWDTVCDCVILQMDKTTSDAKLKRVIKDIITPKIQCNADLARMHVFVNAYVKNRHGGIRRT